jgi:hypothetical protein
VADDSDQITYLKAIARDMQSIKSMMSQVITYMTDAESEIPEKMRRFIMYMHDVHDISYMYEERGLPIPPHVRRELERCDDRYRHILEDLNTDTGAFEKVRQEMTQRAGNRWDHSRLLPKENQNETRPSVVEPNGVDEGRTEGASSESSLPRGARDRRVPNEADPDVSGPGPGSADGETDKPQVRFARKVLR